MNNIKEITPLICEFNRIESEKESFVVGYLRAKIKDRESEIEYLKSVILNKKENKNDL